MNVASADTIAQRMFRKQLRDNPVALRSRIDRDDINDIEIVPLSDFDVAATRQVLRVASCADRTGEIDASDVLEAIDIVNVAPPPALVVSPPSASSPPPPPPMAFAIAPPDGTEIDYEDDAYYAGGEHISTSAVTFNLSDALEPDAEPVPELVERRSLGWIVATVLAAAAALVIGAVVAEHFPSSAPAVAVAVAVAAAAPVAAPPPAQPLPSPSTTSTASVSAASAPSAAVATFDVRSLPAAVATVAGPAHPRATPRRPRQRR